MILLALLMAVTTLPSYQAHGAEWSMTEDMSLHLKINMNGVPPPRVWRESVV